MRARWRVGEWLRCQDGVGATLRITAVAVATRLSSIVRQTCILVIRVCQRHALCNRRAGWDIPELDCITRSNAAVREGRAIGPVDWAIFSDSSGAVNRRIPSECAEKCGCSAAVTQKQEKPLNRRIQVAYY